MITAATGLIRDRPSEINSFPPRHSSDWVADKRMRAPAQDHSFLALIGTFIDIMGMQWDLLAFKENAFRKSLIILVASLVLCLQLQSTYIKE